MINMIIDKPSPELEREFVLTWPSKFWWYDDDGNIIISITHGITDPTTDTYTFIIQQKYHKTTLTLHKTIDCSECRKLYN